MLTLLIAFSILLPAMVFAADTFPDPALDIKPGTVRGKQTIVLAGGCFWCTEAVYERLSGVESVVSGYAGGDKATAHYEIVGSGGTKHAESIQITYYPDKITLGQLLKVFFSVAHDPTTADRQGPDYGPQYRSAVFYQTAEEKKVVEAYIAQLDAAHVFPSKIVTEVSHLPAFYPAEDYHQDYVKGHPNNPYVVFNAIPKLKKLDKYYPNLEKK